MKYLRISTILLVSKALQSIENYIHALNPVLFCFVLFFFMLLAEKSPEIFPKHKGYIYIFISESFALNWYIFVALTNKKNVAPIILQA